MTSEAGSLYVWIHLPGQQAPVVAGRLDIDVTPSGNVGYFTYGRSYLARRDCIPIDQITLPLAGNIDPFTTLGGYPGAILDACPDKWGIKVIDRISGEQEYPGGYLLFNDPSRTGNLAFSLSPTEPPIEQSSREFSLADLMHAAEQIEIGREVDHELLRALHPGTGGARPKCNVIDNEGIWIAKFQSADDADRISIPRLEHATMTLGRVCGIRTAQTRLESIDGRDICLVKRFDREVDRNGTITRRGYLSARSVFYGDPGFSALGSGSYGRLARWIGRHGAASEDRIELFRRMVFNCAVRNSDDHELNHGLVHVAGSQFKLADAFDVLPVLKGPRIHRHALLIGDTAEGTLENIVSNAKAFDLGQDDALAIAHDVLRNVQSHWREVLYSSGFGDETMNMLEPLFSPIDKTSRSASIPEQQKPRYQTP